MRRDGDPILPPARVLRLVLPRPDYLNSSKAPTFAVLAPNSAEEERDPVRISIWDRDSTSLEQAYILSGKPTSLAFDLAVQEIIDVSERMNWPELRAVYEPDTAYDGRPGGDGHGGLEGMVKPRGLSKVTWNQRREELLRCFVLVHEPPVDAAPEETP